MAKSAHQTWYAGSCRGIEVPIANNRQAFTCLDPPMAPAGKFVNSNGTYLMPYWITYFNLGSNDSSVFVGFNARYPVTVYLSSGGGYTSAYGTRDTLTATGSSNWRIYVQNTVDDFNEFNLWGDLTVV